MKEKMEREEGELIYEKRKIIIEPVFGDIKENFGFRQFHLRGLEGVEIEFNIVCIAHNLKKIWLCKKKLREKQWGRKDEADYRVALKNKVSFYVLVVEIKIIMGQRPLFISPNEMRTRF